MTTRERFNRCMRYQASDRIPNFEIGLLGETLDRWRAEGMPEKEGLQGWSLFGGNRLFQVERWDYLTPDLAGFDMSMKPPFEEVVHSEDAETKVVTDTQGVKMRQFKVARSGMHQFISFPVANREDWKKVKFRLEVKPGERMPREWDILLQNEAARDWPISACGLSNFGLFSFIRTLMGMENACMLFYDDPALAEEMLDHRVETMFPLIDLVVENARPDFFSWWEDYAYKNGPMLSPATLRKFLLPRYRKINDYVRSRGIELISIDTDGDCRAIIPLLLEAGINILDPLEVQAGMDPVQLRKEYGHDLRMIGGIDKKVLARSKRDIDKELECKLPALVADGGYIPTVDHAIPHDVSYANWLYYIGRKRQLLER